MVFVYFVRHGETDWNVQKKFQGQSDEPSLTEIGKIQSQLMGTKLSTRGISFSHIYYSDLRRTRNTAILINRSSENHVPYQNVSPSSLLRERDMRDIEGISYDDYPPKNVLHDWDYRHRNEETYGEIYQRLMKFFSEEIRRFYGDEENILCVVHGGIIRTLLYGFYQNTLKPYEAVQTKNTGYLTIHLDSTTGELTLKEIHSITF